MKKTLAEALGLAPRAKKLSPKGLGKLILEEYHSVLLEKEEKDEKAKAPSENPDGFKAVNKLTNIKDLEGGDAYRQLASGDESAPLIQAMMTATGWASGAVGKAGGAPAIKKWAEEVGEAELKNRIGHVSGKLPSGAPAKQDMPALEGGDAESVVDALSPGGNFTIDLGGDYASGKEDFDVWYKGLSDEERSAFEAGNVPGQGNGEKAETKKEGVMSLADALFEDKWPRDGMGPLKGAPAKGEGAPASRQELTARALAFLTKGQLDGNLTDDSIEVKVKGTIANSKMIPTQSNILAGKSLLFAFLQAVGASDLADMGGAFVTSGGEILDGHHRWSGAYIGTGGGLTHSNVNIVSGDADELIPMLVSVGNAIGRSQKGVEEPKKESARSSATSDNLVMERWTKLAGLLND